MLKTHVNKCLDKYPDCDCHDWDISLDENDLKTPCITSGISILCNDCGLIYAIDTVKIETTTINLK